MSNISRSENYFNRPLASFVQISPEKLDRLIDTILELSSKGEIRTTEDNKYSVYDVIRIVCDKGNERDAFLRLKTKYEAVVAKCDNWKFSGERQRETPVADLATIIEIIWLLPGDISDKLRAVGAEIVAEIVTQKRQNDEQNQILSALSQLTKSMDAQNKLSEMKIEKLEEQVITLKDAQENMNLLVCEYMTLRKTTETSFPGLAEMNEHIIDTKGYLPPVKVEFTASEWIQRHAPELSDLQVKRLQRLVADAHRFVLDKDPNRKSDSYGTFVYTSESEVVFRRALNTVKKLIPSERTSVSSVVAITSYHKPDDIELTAREEIMIGHRMFLYKLSNYLGYKVDKRDTSLCVKLDNYIRKLAKQKQFKIKHNYRGRYVVSAHLINAVKQFHEVIRNQQGGN